MSSRLRPSTPLAPDRPVHRRRSLADAAETAELYGLPAPTTVEDPQCVGTTGGWLVLIMGVSILIFLGYNIKVWGLPLVIVALLVALYTIGTVLVWYFHGPTTSTNI